MDSKTTLLDSDTLQDTDNMTTKSEYVIDCENLIKIYKTKEFEVVALQGLDLRVKRGEFTAIIGNSGSGKSTLLNMIGGLDKADAGKLIVAGKDLFKLTEKQLTDYKRDSIGFVWQNNSRNLIPYLTASENIEFILGLKKHDKGFNAKKKSSDLLDLVELSHRKNNRLFELSGGEQQRVAIAIGICNDPDILLADEPTGQVDSKTSDKIFSIFKNLNEELGQTILVVTHDMEVAKKVNRVISISDGRTSSEFIKNKNYAEALSRMDNSFDENNKKFDEHEEFAVVDRLGRVHLPKEWVDDMNLKGSTLKITVEDEEIRLHK